MIVWNHAKMQVSSSWKARFDLILSNRFSFLECDFHFQKVLGQLLLYFIWWSQLKPDEMLKFPWTDLADQTAGVVPFDSDWRHGTGGHAFLACSVFPTSQNTMAAIHPYKEPRGKSQIFQHFIWDEPLIKKRLKQTENKENIHHTVSKVIACWSCHSLLSSKLLCIEI